MAKVSEGGYLGVGASDLAAWQRLATAVFGMQVVPGDTVKNVLPAHGQPPPSGRDQCRRP